MFSVKIQCTGGVLWALRFLFPSKRNKKGICSSERRLRPSDERYWAEIMRNMIEENMIRE
jgi:hypothetical protein